MQGSGMASHLSHQQYSSHTFCSPFPCRNSQIRGRSRKSGAQNTKNLRRSLSGLFGEEGMPLIVFCWTLGSHLADLDPRQPYWGR